ncbi:MAG: MAPEG family protein, partial [Dolichospermum sp.]
MTEPLIELKGISKSFGKNKVLDDVDLKIYRGQALGIIGPSGTGKSTVLRVQQNTLEQLALFIPALWLFSIYISPIWGAALGVSWVLGRIAYAW